MFPIPPKFGFVSHFRDVAFLQSSRFQALWRIVQRRVPPAPSRRGLYGNNTAGDRCGGSARMIGLWRAEITCEKER